MMKKAVALFAVLAALGGGCDSYNLSFKSLYEGRGGDSYLPPMSVDEIEDYLLAASGSPVYLPVSAALSAEWEALLEAIYAGGKPVILDLSACAMDPAVFDPVAADADSTHIAAKGMIVSLTLPEEATGLAGGVAFAAAFEDFDTLKSIVGKSVTDIGNNAFYGCDSLESVNFPAATGIGISAFWGCSSLESVSLPAAMSIGVYAFRDCSSLETVSLPSATGIDHSAFWGCNSLESVSLPAATTIGSNAFMGCSSVTSITLGVTPPGVASSLFAPASGGTIILHVPSGSVIAYTSWAATYSSNFSPKTLSVVGDAP
jgi:hypothetical protein